MEMDFIMPQLWNSLLWWKKETLNYLSNSEFWPIKKSWTILRNCWKKERKKRRKRKKRKEKRKRNDLIEIYDLIKKISKSLLIFWLKWRILTMATFILFFNSPRSLIQRVNIKLNIRMLQSHMLCHWAICSVGFITIQYRTNEFSLNLICTSSDSFLFILRLLPR